MRTQALLRYGVFVLIAVAIAAQAQSDADSADPVKNFLRSYLQSRGDGRTTRYTAAFADLNEVGKPETIVYLTGPAWCGSGGCTALILVSNGSTYDVVTKMTVTRLPIRVLETKTKGWHDLSVMVGGGGAAEHEAKLRFDGRKYPTNPSIVPAINLATPMKGKVVISATTDEEPLY